MTVPPDLDTTRRLLEQAGEARRHAYAPYSGFSVGAALLGESGRVYTGCNVENASYGLTTCAERTAVGAAVAAGERRFRAVAVAGPGERPCPPCGSCRQVLAEFGDLWVITAGEEEPRATALHDLLPDAFGSAELAERGEGA